MTFASSFVLFASLALTAGCASAVARPAAGAGPSVPAPTQQMQTNTQERTVELRHFYLLSPGPNATLVVTRSDVPAASR